MSAAPGPRVLATLAAIKTHPGWVAWIAQQPEARRAWITARMQAVRADRANLVAALCADGHEDMSARVDRPWDGVDARERGA